MRHGWWVVLAVAVIVCGLGIRQLVGEHNATVSERARARAAECQLQRRSRTLGPSIHKVILALAPNPDGLRAADQIEAAIEAVYPQYGLTCPPRHPPPG